MINLREESVSIGIFFSIDLKFSPVNIKNEGKWKKSAKESL